MGPSFTFSSIFRPWFISFIWKLTHQPKNFLVKTKNFLQKAGTSWLNQDLQTEVPGRTKKSENGYLTGYQEEENSPNRVPNREAFFLVGSWLRPEDFGFGHPLRGKSVQIQSPEESQHMSCRYHEANLKNDLEKKVNLKMETRLKMQMTWKIKTVSKWRQH